jgi:hypothetical protein
MAADGEASVVAFCALEDGQKKARGVSGNLFDDAPGETVFCKFGLSSGKLEDAGLPDGEFFFEHADGDGGIAGCADRAVLDGIRELFDRG